MFGVESASIKHCVVHFWLLIRQNSTSGERIVCFRRIASTYLILAAPDTNWEVNKRHDRPANSTQSSSSRMYLAKTEYRNNFQNIWIVNKGVFGTRGI